MSYGATAYPPPPSVGALRDFGNLCYQYAKNNTKLIMAD